MDKQIWRRAGLEWSVLLLLLVAAWFPIASAMATIWWRSDTFAHCLLVPPIAIWLAWRDRARWLALAPRRWAWGLLPLALASLLGLVGELAQVAAASQLALVLALQALTLFVLGPQVGALSAITWREVAEGGFHSLLPTTAAAAAAATAALPSACLAACKTPMPRRTR